MERAERIELSYSAWKAAASPLCHARLNGGWSWYRARWASDNGFTDRPRSLRDYPSMQLSPGSPQAMPAECLSRCCRKVVVPRVRAGTEAARYSPHLSLVQPAWVTGSRHLLLRTPPRKRANHAPPVTTWTELPDWTTSLSMGRCSFARPRSFLVAPAFHPGSVPASTLIGGAHLRDVADLSLLATSVSSERARPSSGRSVQIGAGGGAVRPHGIPDAPARANYTQRCCSAHFLLLLQNNTM